MTVEEARILLRDAIENPPFLPTGDAAAQWTAQMLRCLLTLLAEQGLFDQPGGGSPE
jgi:hypothetical protein